MGKEKRNIIVDQTKASVYRRNFSMKLSEYLLYMNLSKFYLRDTFEIVEDVKEAPKTFTPLDSSEIDDSKSIPYLEKGKREDKLTLRVSHLQVFDMIGGASYEGYLEFLCKNALQFLFTKLDNYLNNCFTHVLSKNPKLLNQYFMLDTPSEDVLDELIEKKLRDINKGYRNMLDFARETLKIKHSVPADLLTEIREDKLIRNCYVHGDGRADRKYLKLTKLKKFKLGEKIPLSFKTIEQLQWRIIHLIERYDPFFITQHPEALDPAFNPMRIAKASQELQEVFPLKE